VGGRKGGRAGGRGARDSSRVDVPISHPNRVRVRGKTVGMHACTGKGGRTGGRAGGRSLSWGDLGLIGGSGANLAGLVVVVVDVVVVLATESHTHTNRNTTLSRRRGSSTRSSTSRRT